MYLLLAAALAASVQQQPHPRPRPVVRDSAVVEDTTAGNQSMHRGRRRAVTAELEATAFKDALAKKTLLHARAARLTQDSALTAYDAMSYQRISAGMGFGRIGRDRLIYRYESAARVRWQQGVGVWIDVKGARTAVPMLSTSDERDETHSNVHDPDMTGAIPYYPGYEPLWVGGDLAKVQVDETELVNPIADGAEAYYTYESGDSISWRLPDKRTIQLRELKVRPREAKWNLSVGSLWFDTQSGQLVRAAYRLAIPLDVWQIVADKNAASKDSNDVPGWVKGMISPLKAEVSAIAIEYGLHDGRFWLPRLRLAEGRADVSFMHVPFKMEESFTYASVNARDSLPTIVVDTTRHGRMSNDMHAVRDSIRAARRDHQAHVTIEIGDDSMSAGAMMRRAQCDTGTVMTSTRSRFGNQLRVGVRVPCSDSLLEHSAFLPKSIYDPGEELFGANELEELRTQALSMSAQAPFSLNAGMLPPPTFAFGPGMMRYNRVEGFSPGASVDQQLGGGYSATAVGRLGFADLEPNIDLTLTRTNLTKSVYLTGYNHLVSASDWGSPLSFGSSFSALMFGRDEGFYYKASGAEIGGTREPSFGGGTRATWRAFVEQERTAKVKTNFAVDGADFPANLVAGRGVYSGVGLRLTNDYGLDPTGFRLFTDARLEAAMGDSAYGRGAVDVTASHGLGRLAGALTLSGGSSLGGLPAQRRWYLGGSQTVRGQSPDTAQSGNAYWLTRLELGENEVGMRPTIFGDLGWVGDRSKLSQVGRPMSGVGAGVSFLDGLFRFDVARGLYPRKQFRVDLYLESKF
ncbi:MAG: ShlB/FhaC/HecB family hemolysin secretion/activation protein [Gemmatimonadales bacterium]